MRCTAPIYWVGADRTKHDPRCRFFIMLWASQQEVLLVALLGTHILSFLSNLNVYDLIAGVVLLFFALIVLLHEEIRRY